MQQYFVEGIIESKVHFSEQQQHHIARVIRLHTGEIVKVVDQSKQAFLVCVHIEKNEVYGIVDTRLDKDEDLIEITLIQAMIKKDKWDFLIQKTCEVGVHSILPMISSRSVVRMSDKQDAKNVRYNKIALEACEQSKRNHRVEVFDTISFRDIKEHTSELNLIAYEAADYTSESLKSILHKHPNVKTITIVVGCEGGFSQDEVQYAIEHGFIQVSLGKRILRAETAAMAMVQSILFYYE